VSGAHTVFRGRNPGSSLHAVPIFEAGKPIGLSPKLAFLYPVPAILDRTAARLEKHGGPGELHKTARNKDRHELPHQRPTATVVRIMPDKYEPIHSPAKKGACLKQAALQLIYPAGFVPLAAARYLG
jgi:hypothetical protein